MQWPTSKIILWEKKRNELYQRILALQQCDPYWRPKLANIGFEFSLLLAAMEKDDREIEARLRKILKASEYSSE